MGAHDEVHHKDSDLGVWGVIGKKGVPFIRFNTATKRDERRALRRFYIYEV